jgi:fucose permease
LAGAVVIALATLPWVFVTSHTPYGLLAVVLFVRGLGLGMAIQPTTAAAYTTLESSQIPRATAAINTLRQIGASVGTALLAVVLQHESAVALSAAGSDPDRMLGGLPAAERERVSGPLATAFAHTLIWAVAMAVAAIVPAVALVRAERASRRRSGGTPVQRDVASRRREPVRAHRPPSSPSLPKEST